VTNSYVRLLTSRVFFRVKKSGKTENLS